MKTHFADRLERAVRERATPLVVGLDPVPGRLPPVFTGSGGGESSQLKAVFEFSSRIIELVAPVVPAVKVNIAFFERYRAAGVEAYFRLLEKADAEGLVTIGDVKRGDIGHTCELYADAHLSGPGPAADAITVNGFAGEEAIRAFADSADRNGRGIFVWVRASNPGAAFVQDFAGADGLRMYERLAEAVGRIAGEQHRLGRGGCSSVGMVVAGTGPRESLSLRERYPFAWFLVPGYGSQGASAADCVRFCKSDGTGAVINASRSVIFAHDRPEYRQRFGDDWEGAVLQAVEDIKLDLAGAMRGGRT
jgi:orotidine-5'-phosphate decarboxylase